jgi:hypothetical protein
VIQRSLISIIPVIATIPKAGVLTINKHLMFDFIKYLKGIEGDKVEAYKSIYEIIEATKEKGAEVEGRVVEEFKSIVQSIGLLLRDKTDKLNFLQKREAVYVRCMHSVFSKLRKEKLEQTFSREEIDNLVSLVLFQGLY